MTPTAAQSLLSAIATSIMTFTSLVISVTIVALQLASQQFSPRVLRTFFRDTWHQGRPRHLHRARSSTPSSCCARSTRKRRARPRSCPGSRSRSPSCWRWCRSATFLYYVNHVVHAIRIVSMIDAVAAETRAAIRDVHVVRRRHRRRTRSPTDRPTWSSPASDRRGRIVTVDEDDLVDLAAPPRAA